MQDSNWKKGSDRQISDNHASPEQQLRIYSSRGSDPEEKKNAQSLTVRRLRHSESEQVHSTDLMIYTLKKSPSEILQELLSSAYSDSKTITKT